MQFILYFAAYGFVGLVLALLYTRYTTETRKDREMMVEYILLIWPAVILLGVVTYVSEQFTGLAKMIASYEPENKRLDDRRPATGETTPLSSYRNRND